MLKTIFSIIAALAWGLWLGGIFAVFVFVTSLFATSRELAVQAAPVIFVTFERYQLVIGGVLLAALLGWRLAGGSKLVNVMFILAVIAAAGAIASPLGITNRMERLRHEGLAGSPEFRRLHVASMWVYSAETGALIATGILMPLAMLRPKAPELRIDPSESAGRGPSA